MKTIKINAIFNVLKMVISLISPMIVFPYVSRVLGADGIGKYTFSFSIVNYFLLMAGLGISTYAIRDGTKYREDSMAITSFISEIYVINIISTFISYFFLLLLLFMYKKIRDYRVIIMILSSEIFFATFSKNWILNIYEDFAFPAICSIIIQFLNVMLTLLLVKEPTHLLRYSVIAASSSILTNIFYCLRTKKYVCMEFRAIKSLKPHIKPILILFSFTVASAIYVSSDTTIIGLFLDDYNVGLYSVNVKLYTVIKNFIVAVLTVLIPKFSLLAEGNDMALEVTFNRVFEFLVLLFLPSVVGIFMESRQIISVLFGVEYIKSYRCLQILCIASIFSLIAYLFIHCILIPKKDENDVLCATVISAAINIFLNLFLIPLWGIFAAALTTMLAELFVAVFVYYKSKKFIYNFMLNKNIFSCIIGSICVIIICLITNRIFQSNLLCLAVSMLISILFYVLILIIMKNSILKDLFNRICKKE